MSGAFTKGVVKVQVNIMRLENENVWTLEVVNWEGTSTVWDRPFENDVDAYSEFEGAAAEVIQVDNNSNLMITSTHSMGIVVLYAHASDYSQLFAREPSGKYLWLLCSATHSTKVALKFIEGRAAEMAHDLNMFSNEAVARNLVHDH